MRQREFVYVYFLAIFLVINVSAQDANFGFNFFNDAVNFFNENLNPFQDSALTNFVRNAFNLGGNNIIGRAFNFVGEFSCSAIKLQFGDNLIMVGQRPKGFCLYCCHIRPAKDIRLYLFNKDNPDSGTAIFLEAKPGALRDAGVDKNASTVMFLHGFSETYPGHSSTTIKNAYLRRPEKYNILLVDWTELCAFPWYLESSQNVKIVAQYLAKFLQFYHDSGELPINNLHIVGFSLGAQVAGFIGKYLRSDLRIPRITGLDPAFPNFPIEDESKRLSTKDANFVDVIHTDGGIFGVPTPIGHADFYPNGGTALQPGCQPSNLVDMRLIDQIVACSHVRAWELFAETVYNPKAFLSAKCPWSIDSIEKCSNKKDSCYMGHSLKNTTRGQFYLKTRHTRPYAMSIVDDVT